MSKKLEKTALFPTIKGRIEHASYHPDPDLPEFLGNPLIEALPMMFNSEDEIEDFLQILPVYSPQDCNLPALKRIAKLGNLRRFYQPTSRSTILALDFDDMLRWGYEPRNPFSVDYVRKWRKGYETYDVKTYNPSGAEQVGIVLIGYGGTGKTQTINRIVNRYPQVIIHIFYNEKKFTRQQVVWLKLDCPEGGTRKGLLISVFIALDSILGTNYFETIARGGEANIDVMMPRAANVLREQHVGTLIIDEFQNLYGSIEGELTIRFLRRINNDLGIPLVLVGTPDASKVLIGRFSLSRRASGYGNPEWRQMETFDAKTDLIGDWDVFFEALARYKYVKGTVAYEKIKQALHEASGGIPDLAIKIFIAAQKRVIRSGGSENVDATLIRLVARDEFPWLRDAVIALNEGTANALRRYHDLYFANTRSINPKNILTSETHDQDSSPVEDTTASQTRTIDKKSQVDDTKHFPKRTRQHRIPKEEPRLQSTFLEIIDKGKKLKQSHYQSLLEAGYISSITDYLE